MKVTFSLDDQTEIKVRPESLQLNAPDNGQPAVLLGYRVGQNVVTVLTFGGHYFADDAMKKHDAAVAKAAVEEYIAAKKA